MGLPGLTEHISTFWQLSGKTMLVLCGLGARHDKDQGKRTRDEEMEDAEQHDSP
jgi:hypothetical protein